MDLRTHTAARSMLAKWNSRAIDEPVEFKNLVVNSTSENNVRTWSRFVNGELHSLAAHQRPRDAAGPHEGVAVPTPPHALVSVPERARACLECGRDFEVDPRHAERHRFHSAAWRSRYRHGAGQALPTDLTTSSLRRSR